MEQKMDVVYTIIIGVIATLVFELLKYSVIRVLDLTKKMHLTFSLPKYWISHTIQASPDSQKTFSAYEFVKLKIVKGRISMQIFQYATDGRLHKYKGCGYIRGSKLSISYEEFANRYSEMTGSLNLKVSKKSEHSIYLKGTYTELQGKKDEVFSYDYCLYPYFPCMFDKLGLNLLGSRYIFNHMKKESFKNYIDNEKEM